MLKSFRSEVFQDFPAGAVESTRLPTQRGRGFGPWSGKIPLASEPSCSPPLLHQPPASALSPGSAPGEAAGQPSPTSEQAPPAAAAGESHRQPQEPGSQKQTRKQMKVSFPERKRFVSGCSKTWWWRGGSLLWS